MSSNEKASSDKPNMAEKLVHMLHHPKPILIAVMGPTGCGKSSFLSTLVPNAAVVGHKLVSCTSEVQHVSTKIDNKIVTFIDTPGFDDTYNSDTHVLRLIANNLEAGYSSKSLLTGIIYFHRITDNRVGGVTAKNLRLFQKLCGDGALSNVILCTTMWDIANAQDAERREAELKSDFWREMVANGSSVARHTNTVESALAIVRPLLSKSTVTLQLQEELSRGTDLTHTQAGVAVSEDLERLQAQHREEMQALRREMEKARGEELQQLHDEYNVEKKKLRELVSQQEALARERTREVEQLKEQLKQRRKKC